MTFASGFHPSAVRLSHKLPPSSRAWLARQYRDPYVKARLSYPANYRSRSAFKLLELDHRWKFLNHDDVRTVVDLGAAPGGWSQVVAGKMGWTDSDWDVRLTKETVVSANGKGKSVLDAATAGFGLKRGKREELKRRVGGKMSDWSAVPPEGADELGDIEEADFTRLLDEEDTAEPPRQVGRGTIVAVDLLRMEPIPGVKTLQMNFLSPMADEYISALLREHHPRILPPDEWARARHEDGKADVILSDMAANFTGSATADIEASITISEAVFEFVCRHLRTAESIGRRRGGVLVLKHFAHPKADEFRKAVLSPSFHSVAFDKPPSSRSESREGYWICAGWKGAPASRR
ncbi:S-adenosyl-L-methionine-dependent methyltransferase [Dichomitus squalens LYAD-421 SS1]|uniref:rRNA methyltransferase 2, mitochondrial n=1 Tax=Dichomitus squalens (strain LYAD-421) TaxID=732165 RepID=R7SNP7_DICSQ|nr:S-adenosyl-L-methionine-dependent methyltransferase [Dichomitus squalens LYAD-421 SS1]EJF57691.1 S-adenosyl-L-methionine-dependent methyltransferase [Dichomitus squalens LYAD-421 SS1]